ncbi:MAG: hypothetical protein EBU83_03380 [bacterium]|nr:hypothetical protein [Candidatus Aquidulcis sp.]
MVGAVLLAATLTLASPNESATVFANRTAFAEACSGAVNTYPDRLAREARAALSALGWEVGGAVGPAFTRRAVVDGADAAAFYVHSHGDLYWDPKSYARVGGFRADAGLCLGAPILLPSEIAAMRRGAPPASLVYISSCHNGERASRLPAAFGIAQRKVHGAGEPDSFYVSYVGTAWQGAALRFERAFWHGLLDGATAGAAFDRALLVTFDPDHLVPEWWGGYGHLPHGPGSELPDFGGERYV